nr:hypothetical protein Iba_chr15fCG5300 [Ipomoea batatas]
MSTAEGQPPAGIQPPDVMPEEPTATTRPSQQTENVEQPQTTQAVFCESPERNKKKSLKQTENRKKKKESSNHQKPVKAWKRTLPPRLLHLTQRISRWEKRRLKPQHHRRPRYPTKTYSQNHEGRDNGEKTSVENAKENTDKAPSRVKNNNNGSRYDILQEQNTNEVDQGEIHETQEKNEVPVTRTRDNQQGTNKNKGKRATVQRKTPEVEYKNTKKGNKAGAENSHTVVRGEKFGAISNSVTVDHHHEEEQMHDAVDLETLEHHNDPPDQSIKERTTNGDNPVPCLQEDECVWMDAEGLES